MADEQRDILDMKSEIEEILISLDKAAAVLNHWVNEYSFHDNPNPLAAVRFGEGGEYSTHEQQSALWYFDYKKIIEFINISADYIHSSRQRLTALVD